MQIRKIRIWGFKEKGQPPLNRELTPIKKANINLSITAKLAKSKHSLVMATYLSILTIDHSIGLSHHQIHNILKSKQFVHLVHKYNLRPNKV
jgi:hypothetical protein